MDNIIYAYTCKQAVEDGEQVDVSTTAAEAGIRQSGLQPRRTMLALSHFCLFYLGIFNITFT
jgi:putative ubiquitin-RnfH superfamily antitoxin RatB of RatAB toxin-antitoxin module